jgi:hypothetical protein
MDGIRVQFPSVLLIFIIIYYYYYLLLKINLEGTWSSLVYGARFENEYLNKVVSSNLTVSEDVIKDN